MAGECAINGEEIANAPEDASGKIGGVRKVGASEMGILVGIGPVVIWNGSESGRVDPDENKSTAI